MGGQYTQSEDYHGENRGGFTHPGERRSAG